MLTCEFPFGLRIGGGGRVQRTIGGTVKLKGVFVTRGNGTILYHLITLHQIWAGFRTIASPAVFWVKKIPDSHTKTNWKGFFWGPHALVVQRPVVPSCIAKWYRFYQKEMWIYIFAVFGAHRVLIIFSLFLKGVCCLLFARWKPCRLTTDVKSPWGVVEGSPRKSCDLEIDLKNRCFEIKSHV